MSDFLVAMFLGVGSGAWAYSFTYHRTGGNTKNSLIIAGVCGGIIFFVLLTLLKMLMSGQDGSFL